MCSNFVIFYVLINEHRTKSRKSASSSFVLSLCLADTFQLASLPFKMDVRLWWGCCLGFEIDSEKLSFYAFWLAVKLWARSDWLRSWPPFGRNLETFLHLSCDLFFWINLRRYGKIACIFHNSVTNINLFVSGTS